MMAPHVLSFLLCGTLIAPAVSQWTTAAQARAAMQAEVSSQAKKLQDQYVNIVSGESKVSNCASQDMCAATLSDRNGVWSPSKAYRIDQYLNPETGSCVRIDLDASGDPLSTSVTGRNRVGFSTSCGWSAVPAPWRGKYCYNTESKNQALDRQQCTRPTDTEKCWVNPEVYGFSLPTGSSYSASDARFQAEICATNSLMSSFKRVRQSMPDTGWAFLGMQETGLYRNWPALYQCRTEAQCSGCSDPRYRGWYASAASGPKDVVIVIDTSGSTSQKNRISHIREAAKWVINTLSEADFAMVVQFNGAARSQGEKLLPVRKQASTRTGTSFTYVCFHGR